MARFRWICVGGAVGTGARYLLSGWLLRAAGPGFPWGTLAVNVAGSFLLGLLMQLSFASDLFPPTRRLVLTTGVMGGFTTYSIFNYETLRLYARVVRRGRTTAHLECEIEDGEGRVVARASSVCAIRQAG